MKLHEIDEKYGEYIGYSVVLVPLIGFLLFIEAVTLYGLLLAGLSICSICGIYLMEVALINHGLSVIKQRPKSTIFWSSTLIGLCSLALITYMVGIVNLKVLYAGLGLVTTFLLVNRVVGGDHA